MMVHTRSVRDMNVHQQVGTFVGGSMVGVSGNYIQYYHIFTMDGTDATNVPSKAYHSTLSSFSKVLELVPTLPMEYTEIMTNLPNGSLIRMGFYVHDSKAWTWD